MVFNKLPKEMRRTLALTLAASMVATGTQTPVLAEQVQEVSVQEVQNEQTEAGEEQNVQTAEQQEEVPVAEQQTGTVGQAEAEEPVEENVADTVSANTASVIHNKTVDTEDLDAEEVIDEEINIDMAAEADNATYVEIEVTSGDEKNGKLSCGFEFNKTTKTARLVKIVPAKDVVNRPKFAEDADEKDKRVTLKLNQVTDEYGNVYTVTSIYNDAGICGSNIPMIDLVIGANVATIGKNAFRNNPVRSLVFEAGSGLSEIGDYAFSTSYLEDDIVIPQKVKSIGEGAFQGTACTNVRFAANTVTTSVGKSAFANCKKLETVLFEDLYAMTEMGESIFEGCTKLQTVSGFPAGVTKVPDSCFSGDSELTKVEYANIAAVTEIGKSAFMKCKKLEADATYNPIGENVTSIGASAFAECGSTYKNATEDYTCFTEITIPAGVTKLEASTFANCTTLEKVTFVDENRVVEIGDSCFGGDTALTICELPAQLEKLGNASFSKTALTSVRIPATLKIANSPFAECQKIKSIQWGTETAKVTKVVDTLFQNLKSAIEVDFADQITEIGASAFASSSIIGVRGTGKVETVNEKGFMNCNMLVGEVNMPALTQIYAYAFSGVGATDFIISNDVTVIDEGAFAKCSNLKAMNIAAGVADVDLGNMTKLGQIGKNAFSGCQAIVSLQLPGTVTKIEEGAFSRLTALANVKFKDNGEKGTTTIGTSAFSGCTNLVDVETASNVGVIDNNAFSDCVKLMRLKLADGLQTIGNSAFAGCKRLEGALPDGIEEEYEIVEEKRVKLPNPNAQLVIPESVTTIGDKAFANCYNNDETHTPEGGSEKVYKIGIKAVHIAGNPAGTTIGASAFAGCQNLTKLTLGEGVTGLGDSALKDTRLEEITIPATFETGTAKNSPFTSGKNSTLNKVTFADGIQVIPQYFLNNITTLTEIEIPASVQKIGDHAFADCSNLTAVTFEDEAASKLTTIDTSAFEGCSLMKLSALPEGVTTINASAFKDCKKISLTELPTGLITIGNAAFENCTMLRIGILPAITTLGTAAFKNCVNLPFLSVNTSNLAEINATAFEGCTGLRSVQIDGGEKKQTTIADGAFATCNSLKWLDIENVKSIGKNAFAKLPFSGLKINNVDTIGESAFAGCDNLENPVIQNVKTIGASAFAGSGAQTDDNKVLLDSIQNVGSRAFEGCQFTSADIRDLEKVTTYTDPETEIEYSPFAKSGIKKVEFSDKTKNTVCTKAFKNVTSLQSAELAYCFNYGNISTVDASAFEGCVNLTDINLSDKLTTINGLAFYNTGLTEITVPASLTKIATASAAGKNVGPFAGGKLRKVTFADGVTKSLQGMFMGTTSLEEVVLPKSLKTIDQNTFKDCSSLKKLSVGKSGEENVLDTVETINAGAFNGCSSLETLTLKNVAKIDSSDTNRTFGDCTGLKKVSVTGVTTTDNTGKTTLSTTIGTSAFKDNKALKEINLDTIKTVSQEAFRGCGVAEDAQEAVNEKAVLSLKNVQELGALAFYGCGFKEVTIPHQLDRIDTGKINAVDYGPFAGGSLESISFEETVNTIPANLCMNTESLKTVDFRSAVYLDKIMGNAFKGCTSVQSLDIPSITTVEGSAFEGCSSLESVRIAAKIVNKKAFADCTKLAAVELEEGITTIQSMAFSNTAITSVTVPSSLSNVTVENGKGPFADTKITSVHGKVEDDTAETGAVILSDKIIDNMFAGCGSITDVTIPASVKTIGTNAFKDSGVKTLQFAEEDLDADGKADGVTGIGAGAFANCALENLKLPATLTNLGTGAFSNNASLKTADLSLFASGNEGSSTWGNEAFKADTALEKVILPTAKNVTVIPDSTFAECSSLTECEIPMNITQIGAKAFEKTGLVKLYLPNQVTRAGQGAFANCDKLAELHISNNMSKIETGTFEGCAALQEVEIPVRITEIGTKAFYGAGLTKVTILGDPVIGSKENAKLADINNQLSVFEQECRTDTGNIYYHLFRKGFTISAKENAKVKTAFFDKYSDKSQKIMPTDTSATIVIYGGSIGSKEERMQWEALDIGKHTATTVKITSDNPVIRIGKTQSLVAEVVKTETDPETGEEKTEEINAADLLVWESSNKDIATVDQNGIVTGRKEGKAVITATAGEAVGKYEIEVKSPIETFVMTKKGETEAAKDLSMQGGDKLYVIFAATKQNKEISDEYSVKAEDPSVISLAKQQDGSYEVKALKRGETSIVCFANDGSGKSQSFKVNVNSTLYDVTDIKDFTSSNPEGTKTYAANSQDSWSYHVDGISKMEVTFDDKTKVENGKDYIYLYNKNGKKLLYDGDKLAAGETEKGYTGTQLAGKTVTVIGDTIRVQIVSDDGGEFYGFGVKSVVTVNKIKYVNGGTSDENPNPAEMRSDAEALVLQPAVKKSATFIGWYADKELTKEITQIEPGMGGVTIYAKWQPNPSVTYELDGGVNNAENPEYVAYDNKEAVKLGEPSRSGYTFLGWYTDQECTQIITEIKVGTKEDMTVYAKWKKNETVLPSEKPTQSPSPDPTKEPETPKPPVSDPTKDPTGTAQPTPSAVPSATPSAVPSETPVTVPVAGTALSAEKAGANYKVVSADEKKPTVAYTAPADKKVTKVTVPSTITVDGITYQVTEIGANAFKGCKKLKKVTIPANVTKIGKKAFYKCKALKTVTIKSKKLSSVGSAAFKGIAKNAVIKLPKAKKTAYKKLLKKKYDKTTKLK